MTTRPCRTCRQPFQPKGKAYYCSDACRCGTDAGYQAGCGCTRCKAAHARNHKSLRVTARPVVPALGVLRRTQALECLGWSTAEQSRRLGMTRSYLLKVRERTTVERATAAKVDRLYDQLSMTRCTAPIASRIAAAARSRGYAPPLAWDEGTLDDPTAVPYGHAARQARSRADVDDVVVDRFLAGEHDLPTTRAERIAIAARWVATGRSLAELERVTGWRAGRYHRISDQTATAA